MKAIAVLAGLTSVQGRWIKNQIIRPMSGCDSEMINWCSNGRRDRFNADTPCGHGDHPDCLLIQDHESKYAEPGRCRFPHGEDPGSCHETLQIPKGINEETGEMEYLKFEWAGNHKWRKDGDFKVAFWGITPYAYQQLCGNSFHYSDNPENSEHCMGHKLTETGCQVGPPSEWTMGFHCDRDGLGAHNEQTIVGFAQHIWQGNGKVDDVPEEDAPLNREDGWLLNQIIKPMTVGCSDDHFSFCYPNRREFFKRDDPCGHDGLDPCVLIGDHETVRFGAPGNCRLPEGEHFGRCDDKFQIPRGINEETGEMEYLKFSWLAHHNFRSVDGMNVAHWGISPYAYQKLCGNSFFYSDDEGDEESCMSTRMIERGCQTGPTSEWTMGFMCDREDLGPHNERTTVAFAQHIWRGHAEVGELPTNPPSKDGSLTKTAALEKSSRTTEAWTKDDSHTKTAEITKDGSLTKTAEITKDGSLTKTAEITKDGSLTKTALPEKSTTQLTKTADPDDRWPIDPQDYKNIDLVWVQDLSESFEDDVENVLMNTPGFFGVMSAVASTRFAAVSFTDKPVEPFGFEGFDYCFHLDQDFGTVAEFTATVRGWKAQGGDDYAEAVGDAIVHAAQMNWRLDADTKRIMVVVTDAPAHDPVDGLEIGLKVNDFPKTDYHCATSTYFSSDQVRAAIEQKDINVVFLTTASVVEFYENYLAVLGVPGSVQEISPDSRDISEALAAGVRSALRSGRT